MKKAILITLFLITLVTILGCVPEPTTPTKPGKPSKPDTKIDFCSTDSDCTCGGIDKNTGKCFLGNKDYAKKYVDTSKSCPDFCTGIAGNLATKCIDSKCMQMYGCLTAADCDTGEKCQANKCVAARKAGSCTADSDCRRGGCSGQVCESKSTPPLVTTCEYKPEYSCYKQITCGCDNGKCAWDKTSEFDDCVKQAKSAT